MQSRTHSFIETIVNIGIGYTFNIASQLFIFPMFGIHLPFSEHLLMGLYFTVFSILRGYLVRRWFTKRTERRFLATNTES